MKTANGSAMKTLAAASKAYKALADAYTALDNFPKLKAQIHAGKDVWAEVGCYHCLSYSNMSEAYDR